jgi:hypothetical protein
MAMVTGSTTLTVERRLPANAALRPRRLRGHLHDPNAPKRPLASLLIQQVDHWTHVIRWVTAQSPLRSTSMDTWCPGGNRTAVDRLDNWTTSRRIPRACLVGEAPLVEQLAASSYGGSH